MPKRTVLMGAAMRTPEPLLPVLLTDPLLRTDRSLQGGAPTTSSIKHICQSLQLDAITASTRSRLQLTHLLSLRADLGRGSA